MITRVLLATLAVKSLNKHVDEHVVWKFVALRVACTSVVWQFLVLVVNARKKIMTY